jgi:hypothetical protein
MTLPRDDALVLDAQVLWTLFSESNVAAGLRGGAIPRDGLAAASGATDAMVWSWLNGESTPPPAQARRFMSAACDVLRQRRQASAEYLRGLHQADPEAYAASPAGMRNDLAMLRRDFPEWEVEPPSNMQAVENHAPGAGKLRQFSAISPSGDAFSAPTVADLRGVIERYAERGAA